MKNHVRDYLMKAYHLSEAEAQKLVDEDYAKGDGDSFIRKAIFFRSLPYYPGDQIGREAGLKFDPNYAEGEVDDDDQEEDDEVEEG